MKFRRATVAACFVVAAALAAATTAPASSDVVGCKAEAGKQIVLTTHFRFTLRLGNVEDMFMPRQVRANHIKHGELMLRGTMTGAALMVGGPARHLEVQICGKTTRTVVTNASPKIVVDDTTTGKTVNLPIAVMQDISVGVADLHYGNNIAIPKGHRFLVIVSWKGERATFHFIGR